MPEEPLAGDLTLAEPGDLALLVHLMSAGRLQLWDKRASLRDRASRILVRLTDGRELRLREFGTKQAAWVKLLPTDQIDAAEAERAEYGWMLPSTRARSRYGGGGS